MLLLLVVVVMEWCVCILCVRARVLVLC